jgi:hypothetical protein
VARAVGLEGRVASADAITDRVHPNDYAVFAGVLRSPIS